MFFISIKSFYNLIISDDKSRNNYDNKKDNRKYFLSLNIELFLYVENLKLLYEKKFLCIILYNN